MPGSGGATRFGRAVALLAAGLITVACAGSEGTPGAQAVPPLPEAAGRYRCLTDDQARAGLVKFADGRGGRLDGYVEGAGDVGVVLAHQRGGDLCMWQPYQSLLARAGYRTISFTVGGFAMAQDTEAAAAELRRRGVGTVMLVGASIGGGAVLEAAAGGARPVAAVVALSPVRIDDGVLAGVAAPVLLVAAEGDFTFAESAKATRDRVRTPGTELVLLPGTAHGIAMLDQQTIRTVLDFLAAHGTGSVG